MSAPWPHGAEPAAAALEHLGPAAAGALVVCSVSDTWRVEVRGDGATTRRSLRAGTGLEYISEGHRRHLFTDRLDPRAPGDLARAARAGGSPGGGQGDVETLATLGDDMVRDMHEAAIAVAEAIAGYSGTRVVPSVTAEAVRERHLVVRSDGVSCGDRTRLELRVGARGREGGGSLRIISSARVPDLVAGGKHLDLARHVAQQTLDRQAAVEAPTGRLPVVLGPGSPAALLHEVCGHGLEVDAAWSEGSAYRPPTGRRVGSPLVTIRDDPRRPAHAPLYDVDDEGRPAGEVTLISGGVLTNWLVDGDGARRTGLAPTGHGRRLSHAHPALARMGTTYLAAGDSSPEEALSGVRRGLYVKAIVAGETDMSSKSFAVLASEANLIENGRITAPVRRAWLTGPGAAVLDDIDVVCDDLEFVAYGFQCGKLGQRPLTVSVGQPTVRVRELGVAPA